MYRNGALVCENISLTALAQSYGTPAYVYSKQAIISRFRAYQDSLSGLPHRICYSVKANSNLAVLAALAAPSSSRASAKRKPKSPTLSNKASTASIANRNPNSN